VTQQEVDVTRFIDRTTVAGAIAALLVTAVPLPAADAPIVKGSKLTQLSVASRQLLARSASRDAAQPQDPGAAAPTSPGQFFKSTKGKVTLALMGAGAGFAVWSIHHDRQPVKSPIR